MMWHTRFSNHQLLTFSLPQFLWLLTIVTVVKFGQLLLLTLLCQSNWINGVIPNNRGGGQVRNNPSRGVTVPINDATPMTVVLKRSVHLRPPMLLLVLLVYPEVLVTVLKHSEATQVSHCWPTSKFSPRTKTSWSCFKGPRKLNVSCRFESPWVNLVKPWLHCPIFHNQTCGKKCVPKENPWMFPRNPRTESCP
jgi:hypothetical protein